MGTYPASKYAGAATKIPGGLSTALKRDLGITPAQYLADAAASAQGVKVIASLKAAGVDVLGSKINGTKLTINVASASDVAAVKAAGATAVIGAPNVPNISKVQFHSVATNNTYGGQGYFYQEAGQTGGNGFRCSIGFNGYSVSTGAPQFVTAGHCATTINGNATLLSQTLPTADGGGTTGVQTLGGTVSGEAQYGSGNDYGIVNETASGLSPQPAVYSWGGNQNGTTGSAGSSAPLSNAPQAITGETSAIKGGLLCKSGSTSGWTCGTILGVDELADVSGQSVNTVVATTCLLKGDSGGAAVSGSNAIGIDSGSNFSDSDNPPASACNNVSNCPIDDAGHLGQCASVFFPMVSSDSTQHNTVTGQQGSNWQLAISVTSTPTVSSPSPGGTVYSASEMTGTITNAVAGSDVSLYLDGSTTRFAKVDASSGSFRIPLAAASTGSHTYTLVAGVGWSQATTAATGTFTRSATCAPGGTTALIPSGGVGDFNCDGNQDLVTRDSNGVLWLYPGNGSNSWLPRVQLASGWQGMTAIVSVGDFNGDGKPDIVARDQSGTLWLYPGNGSNGFAARTLIATGWQGMTAIQGVGDFNGDGKPDLVARDTSGNLWLYPGNGSGGVGTRSQLASGWQGMTSIVGVGDFNGDGNADLMARDGAGNLDIYPGNGAGSIGAGVQIGSGWQGFLISSIGDFNRDGTQDILARDSSGNLYLYPGNGKGGWLSRVTVGSGWNGFAVAGDGATLALVIPPPPPTLSGGVGDFNGDGFQDLITRDGSGVLWLYPGNGSNSWLPRVQLATGWQGMTAIVSVGDLNGDGNPDVVARDSVGTLWLYPGNGSNGFGTRIQLATGWQSMTAIQGVADFDGDGHVDLIARDTTGSLWLYPGSGSSTNTLGARKLISTGWQGYTSIVGAGDFNGDGHTDILARDANANLLLYPGNGNGTLGTPTQIGSGWGGFLISAIGDFNRDGTQDILARDSSGNLYLYPGNGNGGWLSRVQVGSGWNGFTVAGDGASIVATVPPSASGGVGDFNGDGNADLVTRDQTGTLWLYPGNGSTSFGSRIQLGATTNWQSMTAIVAAGDLDGDGNADIVARDASGNLLIYPGTGASAISSTGRQIGTSAVWASMTAIEGVADFNGDNHVDLIARDATGNLLLFPGSGSSTNTLGTAVPVGLNLASSTAIIGIGDFNGDGKSDIITRDSAGNLQLYPGTGTGTVGAPTQIGSGWQGFSIAAIGDFNKDGAEDILSRDANGNLYLYPGNGHGGWLSRVQVGSGWNGYLIVGDGAVSALPTG